MSDAALKACRAMVDAFDDLFAQCLSNGATNAWGQQIDHTKLNEANRLAEDALREAQRVNANSQTPGT